MKRPSSGSRAFQALATTGTGTAPAPASSGSTIVRGPNAGQALLSQIERVAGSAGWRAVVFHLSRLQRVHRAEKHLQIAANMLESVVKEHGGQLFLLPNSDLVAVCKGIKAKLIQDADETLRYLFNDDFFARRPRDEGGFCSSFNLESQHSACLATFRRSTVVPRPANPPAPSADVAAPAESTAAPPDPVRVGDLLSVVKQLDLSPMLRRQMVWKMPERQAPEAHSEEVFISIKALQEAVGPGFDIAGDRLLFGYLTRWLDSHVLKTLSWEHYSVGAPLSFNINLATLRSLDFAKFDKRRPAGWHGRVMLEFQLGDAWSDLPAFLESGRRLKEAGYLRCLDGVVFSALRFLNLRRLDVDYVKVIWEDSLLKLGERDLRELWQSISDCGTDRMILTRCGRDEALKIGRELGIQLFQGWSVNSTAPASSVKIGDAVEVCYANGQLRLGSIREIRADGVVILVGGAEGQTAIMADPLRLRPSRPVPWQLTLD